MNKKCASHSHYRGFNSYQDTPLDRKLYRGREKDIKRLLYMTLSESLVVLFGKSGIGKTSLLNAGVMQPLRKEGYLPIVLRFNYSNETPLGSFYKEIENFVIKSEESKKDFVCEGDYKTAGRGELTLWEYFKGIEFWRNDRCLTPVLILDQFEELFTYHSREERNVFIKQLADIVRKRMPKRIYQNERRPTDEIAPEVKVIISIREDELGKLEEMSTEIPAILYNRFRVESLSRASAIKAIKEPASTKIGDGDDAVKPFTYSPEALEKILDFLCTKNVVSENSSEYEIPVGFLPNININRQRKVKMVHDEIEPFQLQLLCRHCEKIARKKQHEEPGKDIIIVANDIGDHEELEKILGEFYKDYINEFPFRARGRIRKLCETGLIEDKRRTSLDGARIKNRFKVKRDMLDQLVNNHLLRCEPRFGGISYELSHDTLVEPIKNAKENRKKRKKRVIFGSLFVFALVTLFFVIKVYFLPLHFYEEGEKLRSSNNTEGAIESYKRSIAYDKKFVLAYERLGEVFIEKGQFNDAIDIYQKAIENGVRTASIYYKKGRAFKYKNDFSNAAKCFENAVNIDPEFIIAYRDLGEIYKNENKHDRALKNYSKALEITERTMGDDNLEIAELYENIGDIRHQSIKYRRALVYYFQAMEIRKRILGEYSHEVAASYKNIGRTYYAMKNYKEAASNYSRALGILKKGDDRSALIDCYDKIRQIYETMGDKKKALEYSKNALRIKKKMPETGPLEIVKSNHEIGKMYREMEEYEKALAFYTDSLNGLKKHKGADHPDVIGSYNDIGAIYEKMGQYDESVKYYSSALAVSQKVSQKNPGIDTGKDLLLYENLGRVNSRMGRHDEAIKYFLELSAKAPGNASAYIHLGDVYASRGDRKLAADNYYRAKEIFLREAKDGPEAVLPQIKLGSFYLNKVNNYDKAIEAGDKGLSIDKKSFRIRCIFARALLYKGQYEKAKSEYKNAMELVTTRDYSETAYKNDPVKLVEKFALNDLYDAQKNARGEFLVHISDTINSLENATEKLKKEP